jgi:hypothetical protein
MIGSSSGFFERSSYLFHTLWSLKRGLNGVAGFLSHARGFFFPLATGVKEQSMS